MYLPAIVMVGYYFDKRRALATGMAVCGSGIGSFILAPLSEALLSRYSWKGAMWILSGLSLNGIVFAALFRPLEYTTTIVTPVEAYDEDIEIQIDEKDIVSIQNPLLRHVIDTPETALYRTRSLEECNTQSGNKDAEIAKLGHSLFLDTKPRSRNKAIGRHVLRPLERKDIFYSGSIIHLPEYVRAGNEENFVRSMLKVNDSDTNSTTNSTNTLLKLLKDTFDFSLLRSPTFVLYCISCFLCMIGMCYLFLILFSRNWLSHWSNLLNSKEFILYNDCIRACHN